MRLYLSTAFIFLGFLAYSQSIGSLSPDNANDGETLDVTISGLNTNFSQATSTIVSFYFSTGTSTVTTPNNVTIHNDQSLTANVTVPSGTYQGMYGISVFNTIDGCMAAPESFLVNGPAAPVLNSASPSSMNPGMQYNVQINGSNTNFFQSGTNEVYFLFSQATNTLTMASNVNVIDDQNLTADINVPANTYGGDYDVLVYNSIDGFVWLTDGVTVNGPQAPSISSITPTQGNVGGTYTITINGNNTTFSQGSNGAGFFTSSTNTCNLGGFGSRSVWNSSFTSFDSHSDIASATITPDFINVISDEIIEVTVTFPVDAVTGPVYFDLYNSNQGYIINPFEFILNDQGLSINENKKDFSVYPNPFEDQLILDFEDYDDQNVEIEILSMSGKLFHKESKVVKNSRLEVNLETSLSKGVYLLKVLSTDGTIKVKKITKR